jgi:hypothetical protein
VTWRIAGGPVIDARKTMLVDTGAPHSSINRANLHAGLTVIGFGITRVLDRTSECLILAGGEMTLDLGGGDVRRCAWPVWYCPHINTDTLGLDQYTAMGLIPGVDPRTAPSNVGAMSMPPFVVGDLGGPDAIDSIIGTPTPGTLFDTPSPGLFSFAAPQIPQGGAATGELAYAHAWPRRVPPGAVFDVELEVRAAAPLEFVVIAHELPAGFALVQGDATTTLFEVEAASVHRRTLRVRAARHAGDHFWQTVVRVPGEAEPIRVAGRVVVRP